MPHKLRWEERIRVYPLTNVISQIEWSIAVLDSQRSLNLVAGQDHDNPCLWMLKTFAIWFIDVYRDYIPTDGDIPGVLSMVINLNDHGLYNNCSHFNGNHFDEPLNLGVP